MERTGLVTAGKLATDMVCSESHIMPWGSVKTPTSGIPNVSFDHHDIVKPETGLLPTSSPANDDIE
ncbi:MAG: hypothetical protein M3354_06910 [Chloroflexota bacterium]|nr:hypothetical protein [Chloroflexota bacterium]